MLDQNDSHLFRFPQEVRDIIYGAYREVIRDEHAAFSKRPDLAFLARDADTHVPALMRTCKRAYIELAPTTMHQVELTEVHVGFSTRLSFLVFGKFDPERLRKVILHIDGPWAWPVEFFRKMTTAEGLHSSVVGDMRNPDGTLRVASNLKEVELICLEGHHIKEYFEKGFETVGVMEEPAIIEPGPWPILSLLAKLRKLEVIRLRGDYPRPWVAYLKENTKAQVICEHRKGPEDGNPGLPRSGQLQGSG